MMKCFEFGKLKVLFKSDNDVISVVSYGATLHESLKAAEILKKEGVNIRVIDLFSCKPIDRDGLLANGAETKNLIYVIEDHYYEGGAGEAVKSAVSTSGFKVYHKAVDRVPRSGKPDELYKLFGLDAEGIIKDIKGIL